MNDGIIEMLRTRVRLPPSPPFVMKVSELEIGRLYRIKGSARLDAYKTSIMDIPVVRWGSTNRHECILQRDSLFQYLGKQKIKRLLHREQKSLFYIQHTFMLLSDSVNYVIRGYHIRNLELLKQPTK